MKQVVEIPVDDIIITERARVDLGDIDALQKSIKDRGLISPIVVEEKTMELVDGFRRLTCVKNLGLKTIEARYYAELSLIEKKILELEANLHKPYTWDELSKLRAEIHALKQKQRGAAVKGHESEGQSLEDTAEELGISAATLSQDITLAKAMEILPRLGEFNSKKQALKRLKGLEEMAILRELARREAEDEKSTGDKALPYLAIEGDAVENIKTIEDETVDLIFFDPPWGIDADVNATSRGPRGDKTFYDDSLDKSIKLSFQLIPELYRVLKPNCYMYMFVGAQYASFWAWYLTNTKMVMYPDKLPSYEVLEKNRPWQFEVRPVPLVWIKEGGGYTDHEFKIMPRFESLLFCSKGPGKRLNFPISDVLEYNRPLSTERIHPQQKPLGMIKELIKVSTQPDELVLDPCFGSGVVLVGAVVTKRRSIGMEDNAEAFLKAKSWLEGLSLEDEND